METADLTHHISRRFNEDLEKVRNQVLQMGGFVEQQLHKAITALVEGDTAASIARAALPGTRRRRGGPTVSATATISGTSPWDRAARS